MPNPKKIIKVVKAIKPKSQPAKAVGSAASKGRTGTNVNAKGKKVSEGKPKSTKRTPAPDIEVGKKSVYVDREGNIRTGIVVKGNRPNVFTTKTPFVRNNTEANKKLKEINNNLSTLRNSWKATPPSKRAGIENSAKRLQSQRDALIKQLKKGK
jgi:hypothetical protein